MTDFYIKGGQLMAGFDLSRFTALVVDDNDFIRLEMKKNLIYLGLKEVFEAANGMEALQMLSKKPDIIFCDINMEPLNGFEFVKHVRALAPPACDVPVIFLTGDAKEQQVQEARNLGANAYLLKPVTLDSLKNKLEKLLGKGK
jgi:two-component system chemotaxis response regulator CheY